MSYKSLNWGDVTSYYFSVINGVKHYGAVLTPVLFGYLLVLLSKTDFGCNLTTIFVDVLQGGGSRGSHPGRGRPIGLANKFFKVNK